MALIKIRKVISLIVFILFILLFLGAEKWSVFLSEILPPLQFMPALMQTLSQPAALFLAGLILIVFMTLMSLILLLLGWWCPILYSIGHLAPG